MKINREDWHGVNIPAPEVADWVREQSNMLVEQMAKYPDSETFVTVTSSGNMMVIRDTFKCQGREFTRIYECKIQAVYTLEKE